MTDLNVTHVVTERIRVITTKNALKLIVRGVTRFHIICQNDQIWD